VESLKKHYCKSAIDWLNFLNELLQDAKDEPEMQRDYLHDALMVIGSINTDIDGALREANN
jgi:hypothetical protein